MPAFFVVLVTFAFFLGPASTLFAWISWVRRGNLRERRSWLSLAAIVLATSSILLAISSIVYAHLMGGFAFYAPRLMRIYGCGFLLSSTSFITGLIGMRFQNPVRWHAPIAGLGALCFWLVQAAGE